MFADFLDGIGDERLAYAQRWMCEHRKHPGFDSVNWFWFRVKEGFDTAVVNRLPQDVWNLLRRSTSPTMTMTASLFSRSSEYQMPPKSSWRDYDSRRDAEQALADALATLADTGTTRSEPLDAAGSLHTL